MKVGASASTEEEGGIGVEKGKDEEAKVLCWARVTTMPDSVLTEVGGVFFSSISGSSLLAFFRYCLKWGMSLPISISSVMCFDTPTAMQVDFLSTSSMKLAVGKYVFLSEAVL